MKIVSLIKSNVFVPKFNNNLSLTEKERLIIKIKEFPSITTISNFKSYRFKNGATELVYSDFDLIVQCVGEIINLEDAEGKITNGISLAQSVNQKLRPLILEIREYLLGEEMELKEGEEKDSV